MHEYLRPPISNGNPREQALIRRWWHEVHQARGRLVWEYYLGNCFADAVWFPEASDHGTEHPGSGATSRFPIAGMPIVLCEAKSKLEPKLIGQGLLYRVLARRAGADLRGTVILAEKGPPTFKSAAEELGLDVVLYSGMESG